MLMDMSSASVLVSRTRLSSALWCASVLRIDITDQPKAAICAEKASAQVSQLSLYSFLRSRFVRVRTTRYRYRYRRRQTHASPSSSRWGTTTKPTYQTHQKHARSVLPLRLPRRGIDREDDPVDDEHGERPAEHEPHVGVTADKGGLFEFLFRRHRARLSVCHARVAVKSRPDPTRSRRVSTESVAPQEEGN